MGILQKNFRVSTQGHSDVLDITAQVARIVNIAGVGSTLGITTIEFEPGCVADLRRALDEIAPAAGDYAHNARWGDGNGYAHLRSALLGTARSFPVTEGRIMTGTWQQIVLCDFDNRARDRQVLVTVVGE
jgi:secondary thiamine-phosphate synthase enzyme